MNKTRKTLVVASAVLLSGLGLSGVAQAGPTSPTPGPAPVTQPARQADAELAKALTFSREEERMARDLYAQIARRYDDALPFSRITLAEQRHFDAIGALLNRHGIDDPAAGRKAGSYADADIQKLYDGWFARANRSLQEAWAVGVELEQRDIKDLETELASMDQPDVKLALERLLAGSRNHLRAFTAAKDGTLDQMRGQQGRGDRAGQGRGKGMRAGGGQGQDGRMRADCPLRP